MVIIQFLLNIILYSYTKRFYYQKIWIALDEKEGVIDHGQFQKQGIIIVGNYMTLLIIVLLLNLYSFKLLLCLGFTHLILGNIEIQNYCIESTLTYMKLSVIISTHIIYCYWNYAALSCLKTWIFSFCEI
jgi:hypothetical protein